MKHRVTIVQRDIVWQSIGDNLSALSKLLHGVKTDVIVLSEMFQTGFVTSPQGYADDGATLEWMKRMAEGLDAAIVGSVIVCEDDEFRNRLYFVKSSGDVEYYDKHHLFSVGGEDRHFTKGHERKVVEWRGVRYLLEVCYDLRFPVWSRCCGDYDAIIYSALWPKPRREVWRTLLRARAMENQAYVVGVNRIGREPKLEYAGDSMVVDYRGDLLIDAQDRVVVEVVELDIEAMHEFRERFNVAVDADEFILK